jgi:hypothetical protein
LSPVVTIQLKRTYAEEETTRILNASPRKVERLAKSNPRSVTYEKGITRDVPMYDEDEVRALAGKAHTPAQPAVVQVTDQPIAAIPTRNDNSDNRLSQLVAFLAEQERQQHEKPATNARLYSPRATLGAIGINIGSLKFFGTIVEHVKIRQKTIKHTPVEKITDAFIAILAGSHGLVESNTRVRSNARQPGPAPS